MALPTREQALAALDAYLQAECEHDLAAAMALVAPEGCGFGTGVDELVRSRDEWQALLIRQFGEAQGSALLRMEVLKTVELGDDTCLVLARMDYDVVIAGTVERLNPRMSFVLHRRHDVWQLVHLHASVPWSQQVEGESYPLGAIEERNRKLELVVAERTRELQEAMELLQQLATTDKLTGIANRAKLDELIADEHRYLARHPRPSSIAICDLDHFKEINDAHGHLTGDRVLVELAALLGDNLRSIDRLGRWGGEEFLVLLPEATALGAQVVAERVQARLAEHDFGLGRPITMSVGIAEHRPGESIDSWLSRADEMLYRAKHLGRNRILVDGV